MKWIKYVGFWIEGGERTVFSLYCRLPTAPEIAFVICTFELRHRRPPSPYRELYCSHHAAANTSNGGSSRIDNASVPGLPTS